MIDNFQFPQFVRGEDIDTLHAKVDDTFVRCFTFSLATIDMF